MKLIETLAYKPVELAFGTSGLRGLITDMTDLECYINISGFLDFLIAKDKLEVGENIYIAGDLRASTPRIMQVAFEACKQRGLVAINCGLIPTPAVAYYALGKEAPCIMVTGSHIPADRNGIKFYKRAGEVLKHDEEPIRAHVKHARDEVYAQDESSSRFNKNGEMQELAAIPEHTNEAADEYESRFYELLKNKPLLDKHIIVYQHSAVGRDMLVKILEKFGARVTPVHRSEVFIPIDTENITPDNKVLFGEIASQYPDNFAIVSTDGDSDRPFIIDETGTFHRGDIVGLVVAKYLGAKFGACPISSNDAVDVFGKDNGIEIAHTKIGSPYVVEAMAAAEGRVEPIVGWEVNGGFLTHADIPINGGVLKALPTRDAFLPIFTVLLDAVARNKKVSKIFADLPPRYTGGGLIDGVDPNKSKALIELANKPDEFNTALSKVFDQQTYGKVIDINTVDGIRVRFESQDVVHIRPSGNAPQLRVYTTADTQSRADELARNAVDAGGLLEQFLAVIQQ